MQKGTCPPLERAWNASEGAAMVAEWRRSGLSASEFCRERGFGLHRLRYWSSRKKLAPDDNEFVVIPLGVEAGRQSQALQLGGAMLEIQIGRAVCRVPMNAGHDAISAAVRAVLEVA